MSDSPQTIERWDPPNHSKPSPPSRASRASAADADRAEDQRHRRTGRGRAEPPRGMKLGRFLVPRSSLSLVALVKWGCRVSPCAKLELVAPPPARARSDDQLCSARSRARAGRSPSAPARRSRRSVSSRLMRAGSRLATTASSVPAPRLPATATATTTSRSPCGCRIRSRAGYESVTTFGSRRDAWCSMERTSAAERS